MFIPIMLMQEYQMTSVSWLVQLYLFLGYAYSQRLLSLHVAVIALTMVLSTSTFSKINLDQLKQRLLPTMRQCTTTSYFALHCIYEETICKEYSRSKNSIFLPSQYDVYTYTLHIYGLHA